MTPRPESRRSIRVRVTDGLAILFSPGRAPLACAIADISHSGCCIRLSEGLLHESQIEEWREVLVPGKRIECELHNPPHFKQLLVRAAVCHTGAPSNHVLDVGVAFVDVTPEFSNTLKTALPGLTNSKPHMSPAPAVHTPTKETAIPAATTQSGKHQNLQGRSLSEVMAGLGLMTEQAAVAAQKQAQFRKLPLHRYLLQNRLASPRALCDALALAAGLPATDLDSLDISNDVTRPFTYLEMMRHEFLPFAESDDTLWVAAAAPLPEIVVTEIMRNSGKQVLVFLAPANQIRARLFKLRPRPPYQERDHVRMRAALPVNYELCGEHGVPLDELHFDGVTDNISETGMSIAGPSHPTLHLDDIIEQTPLLRANLATPRGDIHVLCRVRHIESRENQAAPGLNWHFGVEILEIDRVEAELLKRICVEMGIDRMRERGRGF